MKFILGLIQKVLGQRPLVLLAILVLAFLLRVTGYNWGGGQLLHSDEQFITEPAYWMALKNTSDPGNYMRPAHWSIYIHHFLYKSVSKTILHQPLESIYPSYRSFFTYLSRIVSAFWGTVLVLVIFHLGNKLKEGVGWISVIFSTIFISYITHSHYVTPDISLALLISLVMLMTLNYFESGNWKYLIALSVFLAWSVGEKYPGLLIAVFVGAHLLLVRTKASSGFTTIWWKRLGFLILVTLLFLFVSTPFLIINFDQVLNSFINESRNTHLGADGLGWGGNLIFYFTNCLKYFGLIFCVFVVVGIFQFKNLDKNKWIVICYPLLYIVILSKLSLHWERWEVPFYIFPILVGSLGVYIVYKSSKTKIQKAITILILSIPVFHLLLQDAEKLTYFLAKSNTISLSQNFCKENGITPENSLFDSYTPFAPKGRFDFDLQQAIEDSVYMKNKKYIILSSGVYNLVFNSRPTTDKSYQFYSKILQRSPFKVFKPIEPIPKVSLQFVEFSKMISNFQFLKSIWIDKTPYVTGNEILIFKR